MLSVMENALWLDIIWHEFARIWSQTRSTMVEYLFIIRYKMQLQFDVDNLHDHFDKIELDQLKNKISEWVKYSVYLILKKND